VKRIRGLTIKFANSSWYKSATYLIAEYYCCAFKVLPLGRYAPMPAPSPLFKTILEEVLWNDLQSCCRIAPDFMNVIESLPLTISIIFGNRRK
jgi:hypothetical protein